MRDRQRSRDPPVRHPGLIVVGSAPVAALLSGHWYDAVAVLLEQSGPDGQGPDGQGPDGQGSDRQGPERLRQARDLATAARRVLDLDAEDFATIAADFDAPWAERLAECSFPLEPRDPRRGALGSLRPLYELMLEVLQLRALRREPLQVVVVAHLIGEYLVQLAWQSVLGHGGDPLKMVDSVSGPLCRWGTDDPACPHSPALKATAKRSLNACSGDVAGYTAYLDRFHSRLGDALSVCAMNHDTVAAGQRPEVGDTCPNPCSFVTRPSMGLRRDLDARVRLALLYVDSPIVALRHHAPVGHFFGVPSVPEISAAWSRTWDRLSQQWPDRSNPLVDSRLPAAGAVDEALPGMSALVSAVAGQPIGPGHLVRDIGGDVARALGGKP